MFLPLAALLAGISLTYARPVHAEELFHNGGMGACNGCHGKDSTTAGGAFANSSSASGSGTTITLKGSDPGSTCLRCHMAPVGAQTAKEYYIATDVQDLEASPPQQLTPGGDFAWLRKTFVWSTNGTATNNSSSVGDGHGHNIVAADFGYSADLSRTLSPGGKFPADSLTCSSCHDPHGTFRRTVNGNITTSGAPIIASGSYKESPVPNATGSVGTYRLLAGKGYLQKNLPQELSFKYDSPAAVAPSAYNRPEDATDTRVAYGSGMSEWCRNCHVNAHASSDSHPSGSGALFSDEIMQTYNSYVSSGNYKGSVNTSYSSLVPFEMGIDDYTVLKMAAASDGSSRIGAKGRPNVICLTCHRAHASGWDIAFRWNGRVKFILTEGKFPGTDNKVPPDVAQGRTSAETQKAYYDRPPAAFGRYQQGLCSKCHGKD